MEFRWSPACWSSYGSWKPECASECGRPSGLRCGWTLRRTWNGPKSFSQEGSRHGEIHLCDRRGGVVAGEGPRVRVHRESPGEPRRPLNFPKNRPPYQSGTRDDEILPTMGSLPDTGTGGERTSPPEPPPG